MERTPGSSLLPVHHQEMLLEGGIIAAKKRRFARAGSSMQENERGAGPGYAAKPDALGYAADGRGFHCRDAAGNDLAVCVLEWCGVNATGDQKDKSHGGSAADENEGCPSFIDRMVSHGIDACAAAQAGRYAVLNAASYFNHAQFDSELLERQVSVGENTIQIMVLNR